jgi:hypothetical protein
MKKNTKKAVKTRKSLDLKIVDLFIVGCCRNGNLL